MTPTPPVGVPPAPSWPACPAASLPWVPLLLSPALALRPCPHNPIIHAMRCLLAHHVALQWVTCSMLHKAYYIRLAHFPGASSVVNTWATTDNGRPLGPECSIPARIV